MVYIIHFDQPYKHARHYVGYAKGGLAQVMERMKDHHAGRGANLIRVVLAAGIGFTLAGTRRGGRKEERRLKNRGGATCHCPICSPRSKMFKPNGMHYNTLEIKLPEPLFTPEEIQVC